MKDKIEQLYISAIQGEWDSVYFAERMMDIFDKFQNHYKNFSDLQEKVIKEASNPENGVIFWNNVDGKYYYDVNCTKEVPKIENFNPTDDVKVVSYKLTTGIIPKNYDKNT